MSKINIAIDAMGGDHGLDVIIPACINIAQKYPEVKMLLVGDKEQIKHKLSNVDANIFSIVHASQIVAMDELPSHALRNKKDSSMRVALNLVKKGEALACVSAGNTGALMATARFVLKTLPGIDRPAIIAELPTLKGRTRVIDLGANIDSCAEHLFQFAVMGSALIQALDNKKNPKIGLLNIGVEEIKGNDQIKRTAHLLASCDLINYIGYVEGNCFYTGDVDLIVCDGFVGNVALKASEGIVKLILTALGSAFKSNVISKLIGLIAKPYLSKIKNNLDPPRYNGAIMLGLNGIVVKSHGGANQLAFEFAIEKAILQAKNNVVKLVKEQIASFIEQGLLL